MKKRFITTAAMAAITATMLLNGCDSVIQNGIPIYIKEYRWNRRYSSCFVY